MTDEDKLIEASCALLDIPIEPEWRAGVALHLGIVLGQARTMLAEGVPDATEPAPVFRA